MPSIGRLFAKLGLDNTELEQKGKQSEKTLKGLGGRMRGLVSKAAAVGVSLGAVGAAIAVNLVQKGGEAARALRNMAEISGTTTREFQRNAFAAKQFGVESEKLSDIYKDALDRVGDFLTTGAGPMADFFEQIAPKVGVTADEFRGLSGPEVMEKYVRVLEEANVSQQEMTFFLEAMAGDSAKLLPLLRGNSAELERLGDRAENLGLVLSDIQLSALEDGKQALDELAGTMKTTSQIATASMAPAIQALAEGLNEILADALDDSKGDILDWGDVAGDVLAFTADAATGAFRVIGSGFEAAGETLGGGVAQAVAILKGNFEESERIAEDWRARMAEVGRGLAEDDNFSVFRDRLAAIREEQERLAGIEEIRITTGRRGPNLKQQQEIEAAEEAAKRVAEIEAERARVSEERERALLEARLDMIRESVLSEADLERHRHAQALEILEQGHQERAILDEEYLQLREDLEAQHVARLAAIREAGLSDLERFTESSFKDQARTVSSELANMTAGVAHHSRAMFEINKAAGIASAIVNTAEGVTRALAAYPPPVSFAMAAAQAAAGAAQIAAIKSQSFGGGGGVAPSLAGSTPAPPVSPVASGTPGGSRQVIAVEGISADQLFSGSAVRALLEQLQDAVDDGAKLVITT